jgi:hypothetical protein
VATITSYLPSGIRIGQKLDLWVQRVFWFNVGDGRVTNLSDFNIDFKGRYDFLGQKGDINLSFTLTDRNPYATNGACKFTVNSVNYDGYYEVKGDTLFITNTSGEKQTISLERISSGAETEVTLRGKINENIHLKPAVGYLLVPVSYPSVTASYHLIPATDFDSVQMPQETSPIFSEEMEGTIAACKPATFNNISQAVRNCFEENGRRQGVDWQGDNTSGKFSKSGVVTEYKYDPQAQKLTLRVIEKPWIVSCDFLYGKMHEGLQNCGASELLLF